MPLCTVDYLSAGGNRHSSAADAALESGNVAFGVDQNVAVWHPLSNSGQGIGALLSSHISPVTAVKYLEPEGGNDVLVTGSADGELRLWAINVENLSLQWSCKFNVKAHEGSINAIANCHGSGYVATGGSDALIKIWRVSAGDLTGIHTIKLTPRYIPLSLVLGSFDPQDNAGNLFLVVGGTKNTIQVYALLSLKEEPHHELQATLTGHEGWIRSLALWRPFQNDSSSQDMLLASGSNDKYIRLWRIRARKSINSQLGTENSKIAANFEQTLTNKKQIISAGSYKYSISFDALLLGHEDWVYSVQWASASEPRLLSASADGSLSIWELDEDSGIWVAETKLGELGGQKGATTATGSSGGFWTGLWLRSEGQDAVACLGRTGSWRVWTRSPDSFSWDTKWGVTGHIGGVNGITWSTDGGYLLSTSSDQTTRLHAEWTADDDCRGWHEIARPQIHGYDLNCITSVNATQFVSGADEKLLRVFDEPSELARLLERVSNITGQDAGALPDVASIPVLGLSNKAVGEVNGSQEDLNGEPATTFVGHSLDPINEPTPEDMLARHTLWPEREKLYGHGYEISDAAACGELEVLATACKASSIDHAVIRLYDTTTWHEIKPPLTSHSLTVTRLSFSPPSDRLLLSVGRDRQWSLFKQDELTKTWRMFQSTPKAHARMILDCAWAPFPGIRLFATAGRDKTVKIWSAAEADGIFELKHTLKRETAVTAVSMSCDHDQSILVLAVGEEDGQVSLHMWNLHDHDLKSLSSMDLERKFRPSRAISRLAWRPHDSKYFTKGVCQLAIASEDTSVRILRFDLSKISEKGSSL